MIKIEKVSKIFKSKNKEICKAIDNISFNLPDTGFVFVVGKSGSGKTTLLNLIAGLDDVSSGEIFVNGHHLNKLKKYDLDYFRNENIGFIFQDYEIFDQLTVYDNVKLALDFLNEENKIKIDQALKDVELTGFENRYPSELSGGEKQRVAIARAIVKNPSIILADEPTGNLDTETTKQVLSILKKISSKRLVIIVSHNIFDAHQFADYILELANGHVIGTYKRNDENLKNADIQDGILRVPLHKQLNNEDKNRIVENINNGISDIVQDDLDFEHFDFKFERENKLKKLSKKHIKFSQTLKRGFNFVKSNLLTIFIFSLITSTLFGLVSVSQFSKDISVKQNKDSTYEMYDRDIIPLNINEELTDKNLNYYNQNEILEEDENILKTSGYNGKYYKAYSFSPVVGLTQYDTSKLTVTFNSFIYKIISADINFFNKAFGKLEFLATSSIKHPNGLYITDFLFDNYNFLHESSKNSLEKLEYSNINGFFINGVIKTNYKQKYKKIMKYLFDKNIRQSQRVHEAQKNYPKLYSDFMKDCSLYLLNGFVFGEKELNDLALESINNSYYLPEINVEYDGKEVFNSATPIKFCCFKDNHIRISKKLYEKITGKKIPAGLFGSIDIEPINLKLKKERYSSRKTQELKASSDITIDQIYTYDNDSYIVYLSNELYKKFISKAEFKLVSLILFDTDELPHLIKNKEFKNTFEIDGGYSNLYRGLEKVSPIFSKIFKIIYAFLIFACATLLVYYGTYIVNKNIENIGILKSLGARSNDILFIFSINLLITILLISVFYAVFAYLFTFLVDKILLYSFARVSLSGINLSCKIVFFNFKKFILNYILIFALSILSFVTVFLKINRYKPKELIRNKK